MIFFYNSKPFFKIFSETNIDQRYPYKYVIFSNFIDPYAYDLDLEEPRPTFLMPNVSYFFKFKAFFKIFTETDNSHSIT